MAGSKSIMPSADELIRELAQASKEGLVQIEKIVEAATAQGIEKQFALDTIYRLVKEGVLFEPARGLVKRS